MSERFVGASVGRRSSARWKRRVSTRAPIGGECSKASELGFTGTLAELAAPQTNARYSVAYLAQAWRLAGGDLCIAS